MAMGEQSFAKRLQEICSDYNENYRETPPIPVSSMERMNSLLRGTRKPTVAELVAISEAYDVSINYLLTGDELFPGFDERPEKISERDSGFKAGGRDLNNRVGLNRNSVLFYFRKFKESGLANAISYASGRDRKIEITDDKKTLLNLDMQP